jgi:diguanylate cyclase (GGDEF)-like protein/PAS domain S-box-containing protein
LLINNKICFRLLIIFLGLLPSKSIWANEQVVLQLKWLHQFQFAGYYAAKEKGYYAEAGFDVIIKQRDISVKPIDAVLEQKADFGIIGSSIILDRMKGLPVVALGAVFQHSPLVLISRADDGLIGPYELKGKRVMYRKGYDDATFIAMFHQLGMRESDFKHVSHSFDPDSLIQHETDAISGYLTDQPFYYHEKGLDIQVINPLNYGIDFYDDILFTSEKAVVQNPERARKFLEASLKGWRYALKNKSEAIDWLKTKYNSDKSIEHLHFEAEQTEKMILPDLIDIGHMSSGRFQRIADIYKQRGFVPANASYEGIDFKDYLYNKRTLSLWAKVLLIIAGASLLLTFALLGLNRRLKSMVSTRASELNVAQANLARYIDILDRYVIYSQTDLNGVIIEASTAFCEVSGYQREELVGQSHDLLKHPDTANSIYEDLWKTITKGQSWAGELKNITKDGSVYWLDAKIDPIRNETGDICGYISIRQNITDKKHVEQLSITDSLTGLNNRLRLDEIMLDELKRRTRYPHELSIIICDIDFFKDINDSYGHLVGDQVLKSIASILHLNCREVDIVGRWGGEEFLIICRETNIDNAMIVAEKLRSLIENHMFTGVGHKTASFGVTSVVPNESIKDIFQRADQALYLAKESGRNRVECQLKKT